MEYNLRDAVLCPALHWDTDIVSVGERHAQARAAAEFRSYHGGWAQAGGLSKFGTYDLLPYRGGWAQAGVLRKKESLKFLKLGTAVSETEKRPTKPSVL